MHQTNPLRNLTFYSLSVAAIETIYETVYGNIDPDDLPAECPTEQVIMSTFTLLLDPEVRRRKKSSTSKPSVRPSPLLNGGVNVLQAPKSSPPPISPKPELRESPNGKAAGNNSKQGAHGTGNGVPSKPSSRPVPPKRTSTESKPNFPSELDQHAYSEVETHTGNGTRSSPPSKGQYGLCTKDIGKPVLDKPKGPNRPGANRGARAGPGLGSRPEHNMYEAVDEDKCEYEAVDYEGEQPGFFKQF